MCTGGGGDDYKAPEPQAASVAAPSATIKGVAETQTTNTQAQKAKGKRRLTINPNSTGTGVNL